MLKPSSQLEFSGVEAPLTRRRASNKLLERNKAKAAELEWLVISNRELGDSGAGSCALNHYCSLSAQAKCGLTRGISAAAP